MDTLKKYLQIEHEKSVQEAEKFLHDLGFKITNELGVDGIISKLKSYVSILPIPDYAKNGIMDYKGYKLEVNRFGYIDSLEICECIEDKNSNDHWHVELNFGMFGISVSVGEHRREMKTCVEIKDLENIF